MIAWILIGLLIIMFAYMLLAPFSVRFDSREAAATIKLFHLGNGRVCYRDESLWLELRLLGLRFEWDAIVLAANVATQKERKARMRAQKKALPEKVKPEEVEPTNTSRRAVPLRKMLAVLRSFEMPECIILLDTGSPAQNGKLFPLAWWVGRWSGKPIGVNFHGQNICVLEVRNSIGRILWEFMRSK